LSTPFRLLLPAQLLDEMVAQARAELPNECCGLLAGRSAGGIATVERRYPLVNAEASPVEYTSEPRSMFAAVRDMRRHGIDVVAVYHSHPTSEAVPSKTDRERNYSEDVICFIVSLKGTQPDVRAWWLTAEEYREAEWAVS
jgi:[CysO sulfur-carrier protein]-S-L-cysteine hydrolase